MLNNDISKSSSSSSSISMAEILKILKIYKWKNENFLVQKIGYATYSFLDDYQRKLLYDTLLIKTIFTTYDSNEIFNRLINDFSIVVFPSAKAFEGFIKKLLLAINLITQKEIKEDPYKSIGKIINGEQIQKKILDKKRDRSVLKLLVAQWDFCRNVILHYDLDQPEIINKEEAFKKIEDIYEVMKRCYKAFIGDPNKAIERKGLTAKELQDQINSLLGQLLNLQKQLFSVDKPTLVEKPKN